MTITGQSSSPRFLSCGGPYAFDMGAQIQALLTRPHLTSLINFKFFSYYCKFTLMDPLKKGKPLRVLHTWDSFLYVPSTS